MTATPRNEEISPIGQLILSDEPSFSFEFFPPKDADGEKQLFETIAELEQLNPSFVSVTYGAGGTTRDRTIGITARIAQETGLLPMAHLTCVGHTEAELRQILAEYAASGVHHVMALRGDPPAGPQAPWEPTPGGLHRAVDLVKLAKSVGNFGIGVAAFPEKNPASDSLDLDVQIILEKAAAGAEFAITQLFFTPEPYLDLVARVRAAGSEIPILPGIMPILNLRQVTRMAELSGVALPDSVVAKVAKFDGDPAAVRAAGIALATELCAELLAAGAPGLHFYTLNRSKATREIYAGLSHS